MWMMLQQAEPEDFVIGIGETHSVRELCDLAFSHVGLNYEDFVVQDPRFYRPAEVDLLVADPKKAVEELGWQPKIKFEELIHIMVDADLKRLALEID
jgi:GDPmannose 4,6-dehydratase